MDFLKSVLRLLLASFISKALRSAQNQKCNLQSRSRRWGELAQLSLITTEDAPPLRLRSGQALRGVPRVGSEFVSYSTSRLYFFNIVRS